MRGKKRVLPSSFGRVASYICSICLEGLEDEEAAILPECTHRFHRRCKEACFDGCTKMYTDLSKAFIRGMNVASLDT